VQQRDKGRSLGSVPFSERTPFRDLRLSASDAGYDPHSLRGNRLRPNHQEFADGVKLAAIAAVTAVLTATVVIGAGRALLPQVAAVAAEQPDALTPIALR